MNELDALQRNLNVKLRSSTTWNDAGHTQEQSSVTVPLYGALPGIDVTAGTSLRTLETFRTETTAVEGHAFEHKSHRTEFEETDHRHEVLPVSGKETRVDPDDGYTLSSRHSPLEMEQARHYTTERTIGGMLEKGDSSGVFPFIKDKRESVEHDAVVDSFFNVEKQRSSPEDRRPSVDSELSVSDVSGDLSVSGYVQNNTKSTRFADFKDSWLSSEEEDNTNTSQSEKPGLSTAPCALNAHNDTEEGLNSATESCVHHHGIDNHASDRDDDDSAGDNNDDGNCHVMRSQVDGEQCLEDSIENHNVEADFTTGTTVVGSVVGTDHEIEPNSHGSYNSLHSRELPKQAPLSSCPTSYQQTNAMLPNFFMPSEQLEESMRALRLGSSTNNSHSKLLSRSKYLKSDHRTKRNLTEKFAKRQPVYKARRDERPPISNSEVDRIAKIFNSGSVS